MATSRVNILVGTALKLNGELDADHTFSMEGVATGAGRVSVQIDLGVSPRPFAFKWKAYAFLTATPTQGSTIDFYKATAPDSDATMIDGDVGAVDAVLADIDQLRNLSHIGSIVVEEANTTKMVGGGAFICRDRYLTLVGVNRAGSSTNATDSNFRFILEPYELRGEAT